MIAWVGKERTVGSAEGDPALAAAVAGVSVAELHAEGSPQPAHGAGSIPNDTLLDPLFHHAVDLHLQSGLLQRLI